MKKIDDSGINPSNEPTGDKVRRVAKAATSIGFTQLLPMFGAVGSQLFDIVVGSPLEKRKSEWRAKVTEAINELVEQRGIDINELKENDEFLSMLLEVSQMALRTHQSERLIMFGNIIKNTVLLDTDYELKQLYLGYVTRFSTYHIRMLKLIDENEKNIPLGTALEYDECERWIEQTALSLEKRRLAARIRSELEDIGFIDSIILKNVGYMKLSVEGRAFFELISESQ